ncbi:MAG: membrane protein [Myxococcales bacterium]
MTGALIIAALIALNALFVAAEFAIVGAPRAAIEHRAAGGHRLAARILRVLRDPASLDRLIATAQLGITAASLGLGMIGEHLIAEALLGPLGSLGLGAAAVHTAASVASIAILTYLHIVLGEMIPKALALQSPERLVLLVTPIMLVIETALLPLVVAFNGIGNLVLRAAGIERKRSSEHMMGPEELSFVVKESRTQGALRSETGEVLRRLLAFPDLTASEVMVPRVKIHGIEAGASAVELRRIVRAARHTRYPVYEHDLDHIRGSVHIKALLACIAEGRALGPADVRQAPFVPETLSVEEVLGAMSRAKVQLAIVMDEHGGTAGLVSIDDLFDEVVGAVPERSGEEPFTRTPTGMLAKGTVRLDELGDELGVALEHEDVDTISGLILALLGRPPEVGDVVTYDHVRFVVTALDGRGVGAALATLEPSGEAEQDA